MNKCSEMGTFEQNYRKAKNTKLKLVAIPKKKYCYLHMCWLVELYLFLLVL